MCVHGPFLCTSEEYSVVPVYHRFFNFPPIEKQLSYFLFGVIINKAAINLCTGFTDINFHFSGLNAQSTIARLSDKSIFCLLKIPKLFFRVALTCFVPIDNMWSSFSLFSPTFGIVSIFFSCSNSYIVIWNSTLNLHVLYGRCWISFRGLILPSVYPVKWYVSLYVWPFST